MQATSPRNKFSDHLHGLHSLKRKDFDKALVFFRRAVEQNPDFPLAHHCLGETYFAISQFVEAENSFRKAVELDPHFSLSFLYLGKIAEVNGNGNKKDELFERAFSQRIRSPQELIRMAQTLIKIGETDNPALIDLYLEANRLNPNDFNLYLEIAEVYPHSSQLLLKFGEQLINSGHPEHAAFFLYLAGCLQPERRECWLKLSQALEALGDSASAEICRERAGVVS